MNKKELKKEKLVFALSLLSLIFTSLIIGNIFKTFFILLFGILAISLVYSLIEHKKDLLNNFKKHSYVLSFSLLITIIFSVLWSYIILPDQILNTFRLQYIYLTPILLLFFFSSYFFQNLLSKKKFHYNHIVKCVLLDVAIVSIIVSIGLLFSFNYVFDSQSESYEQTYIETIAQFQEIENSNNLDIIEDIQVYQNNFLENINNQKLERSELNKKTNFFSIDKKTEIVVDQALHIMDLVITQLIIEGKLENINEQYYYLNSEEFNKNYTSLGDYNLFLIGKINNSNFTITYLSEEEQEVLDLLSSGITYLDLEKVKDKQLVGSIPLWEFNNKSLFFNSLNNVLDHSILKKEIFTLIMNVLIYTAQQGTNDNLLIYLYEHQDNDESLQSQILRNYIIYKKIR